MFIRVSHFYTASQPPSPWTKSLDKFQTIQCQFQWDVIKMNAGGALTPISFASPKSNTLSASSCMCASPHSSPWSLRTRLFHTSNLLGYMWNNLTWAQSNFHIENYFCYTRASVFIAPLQSGIWKKLNQSSAHTHSLWKGRWALPGYFSITSHSPWLVRMEKTFRARAAEFYGRQLSVNIKLLSLSLSQLRPLLHLFPAH